MSTFDIERVIGLFLRGENLEHAINTLCNHREGQCNDPITSTISVMITTPVCFSISEGGLSPFEKRPDLILPFNGMNKDQLEYISEVINEIQAQCKRGNGISSLNGFINNRNIILTNSKRDGERYLNSDDVIASFIRCTKKSLGEENWAVSSLINVILQRLASLGNIHISNFWQSS